MGAESSSLQDFKIDDSVTQTADKAWTLHSAKDVDGARVSVFVYETSVKQSSGFMENAAKQLKLLRHPCILRFLSWKKTATGGLLVTEPIKPLESMIDTLTGVEICAGLYNIIDAVSFLHDKGGISHNNISLSSIFVAEDGSWKLGGMECVCGFDQATPSFLQSCATLRDKQSIPPEERSSIKLLSKELKHTRDAYAIGVLCQHLLTFLEELDIPTSSFEQKVEEFLNPDPKKRPKVNTLLEDKIFRNEFLEIINFLRQITLKSEEEKKMFFETIVEKLYALPQEVVAARLARPLLSRFVLLDSTAVEELLPHLLMPCKERGTYDEDGENPILCEDLFRIHVIPELFKIFHVRDAHIRMTLLLHFHAYMHLFDRRALRAIILPQILLGVKDLNDNLVASSLHALAYLVPVLGGDVVVGGSRGKIFSEAKPIFSTSRHTNGDVDLKKNMYPVKNGETLLDQVKFMEKQRAHAKLQEKRLAKKAENQNKKKEHLRNTPKETVAVTNDSAHNISETRFNTENINEGTDTDEDWSSWDKDGTNDIAEASIHLNDTAKDNSFQESYDNQSFSTTVMMNESVEHDSNTTQGLQLSKPKTKNPLKLTKPKKEKDKAETDGLKPVAKDTETVPNVQTIMADKPLVKSPTAEQAPSAHSKPKNKLGEEFDIMALDVKVSKSKSNEIDFFAEMEPEIKSTGMNLLETLSAGSAQSAESRDMPTSLTDLESAKFSTVSRLNFAVQTDAKDESGWGDEAWDDDFPELEES